MLLGFAAFTSQIPVFLFASVGGAVADRHNRHRIVITTQILSMILPFILAVLTLTRLRCASGTSSSSRRCLGLVNAFDIPARQAFIVDMVGREDLMNAIALNSSMVNGARVVGPGGRGAAGRRGRRGLVLPAERPQLPGGDRRPADDARSKRRRGSARRARPSRDIVEGFRFVCA